MKSGWWMGDTARQQFINSRRKTTNKKNIICSTRTNFTVLLLALITFKKKHTQHTFHQNPKAFQLDACRWHCRQYFLARLNESFHVNANFRGSCWEDSKMARPIKIYLFMIFMYVLHGFYPLFRMNQHYPYKTGSKQIKFYAHKKSDGVFLSRCHLVVTSLSLQQLHITPSLRRSVPPFSSFAPARPSHQKGNKKLRCSSEATLPNLWTHTFLSFSPKSLGFRH